MANLKGNALPAGVLIAGAVVIGIGFLALLGVSFEMPAPLAFVGALVIFGLLAKALSRR